MRMYFYVLLLVLASFTSFAKQKYYLHNCKNLDSLSNVYFEKGDSYFLLIDAYKEGFIKDGMEFTIYYKERTLTLNGQSFPDLFRRNEIEKLRAIDNRNNSITQSITISPELDNTKNIFVYEATKKATSKIDTNSVILREWHEHTDKETELVKLLVAEKIIVKPTELQISYNQNTILINKKPIEGKLVKRYLPILVAVNKLPPPGNENEFAGFDIDVSLVKEVFTQK